MQLVGVDEALRSLLVVLNNWLRELLLLIAHSIVLNYFFEQFVTESKVRLRRLCCAQKLILRGLWSKALLSLAFKGFYIYWNYLCTLA